MANRTHKRQQDEPGFTVWLTGLPGSGKSTLGAMLAQALECRRLKIELLDGDTTRLTLSSGLGFSKADRDENIRRVGFVSRLLSKHGVAVVVAAVSPYRRAREEVRASIANFVEVYVNAPLEVCIARDPKGLYKCALAGTIRNFTGISDPYEAPQAPEVIVQTDKNEPEACVAQIIAKLQQLQLIPAAKTSEKNPGTDFGQAHRADANAV